MDLNFFHIVPDGNVLEANLYNMVFFTHCTNRDENSLLPDGLWWNVANNVPYQVGETKSNQDMAQSVRPDTSLVLCGTFPTIAILENRSFAGNIRLMICAYR